MHYNDFELVIEKHFRRLIIKSLQQTDQMTFLEDHNLKTDAIVAHLAINNDSDVLILLATKQLLYEMERVELTEAAMDAFFEEHDMKITVNISQPFFDDEIDINID